MSEVPVINIESFTDPSKHDDEARSCCAKQWDATMRDVGFALIVGHGVPASVIELLRGEANTFFQQTPDVKQQYNRGPYGCPEGGYTGMGKESVVVSRGASRATLGADGGTEEIEEKKALPDMVESFVLKQSTADPPNLASAGERYRKELMRVLECLHRMTASALKLPAEYFEPYHQPEPSCSLRLAYYPPVTEDAIPEPGTLRYSEHTDYTGYTILHQDPTDIGEPGAGGLEVKLSDGWKAVNPVPGSFVVNIGDLYQVWTNDRWRSTVHRVSAPSRPAKARLSIPFFTGPHNEALIEAIPSCVEEGCEPNHQPVTAGEHLLRKLRATQA